MKPRYITENGIKIYCRYDEIIPLDDFNPHPDNPNTHPREQLEVLAEAYKKNGIRQPIKVSNLSGFIIAGHGRLAAAKLAGLSVFPVEYQNYKDKKAEMADLLSDNKIAELAEINPDILKQAIVNAELDSGELQDIGFTPEELDVLLNAADNQAEAARKELDTPLLIPATSILKSGGREWQNRKRAWKNLGLESGEGRDDKLLFTSLSGSVPDYYDQKRKIEKKLKRTLENKEFEEKYLDKSKIIPQTSIFDPVLCEVVYNSFTKPGDKVVDPFTGGSVRGIVAHKLGREYTGVDLRQEQIDANIANATDILGDTIPHWITGDSNKVLDTLGNDYDFCLSCPPYADLEVYSDDPADISNMPYAEFLAIYTSIIKKLYARLADNRFVAWVIGEVRGKDGNYYNFLGDTITAFLSAGFNYYNEIILQTPTGTAPMRSGRFGVSRKVCKIHQNVLIFVKGDGQKAAARLGDIQLAALNNEDE